MVDKKYAAIAILCVTAILCLGLYSNSAQEANRLKGELWELEDDYDKLALVRTSLEENYSELRTENEDLETDYSILKSEYDSLKTQTRSHEVNVTKLAIDLMAKRSKHSWEEGYYNPDIQGLVVILETNSWASDIYKGLEEEFQKRGGGVIRSISLYPLAPGFRMKDITEMALTNKQGQEFIETYGIDHVAILYIGGSYSYFLSKPEAGTPTFDKLPLIAIIPGAMIPGDRQYLILENPPWG